MKSSRIEQRKIIVLEPVQPRLDVQSVPAFKETSGKKIAPGFNVIMDLRNVEFIDSTGLGALLSLLRKVKESEDQMVLTHVSEQALAMFRLVKMTRIFDIYDSTDEALEVLTV